MPTLPPIYVRRKITPELIERARRMSVSERVSAGCDMFVEWAARCRTLLRAWHPNATEADISGMIRRHIEEEKRREYAEAT